MTPRYGITEHQAPEKRTASGIIIRENDYGRMKGSQRNAPCPCGSGRKFKRCHGRAT